MTTTSFEFYRREKVSGLDPASVLATLAMPQRGASDTADALSKSFIEILRRTDTGSRIQSSTVQSSTAPLPNKSLIERLYDVRAAAKVMISKVAMHLNREWRQTHYQALDELLDPDAWHEGDDQPLTLPSFETYLRFSLFVKPKVLPYFGISDQGNLLAGWTAGRDRLSIEMLPRDEMRWVLVRYLEGERESAAGQVPLLRLLSVLQPFAPEHWFNEHGGRAASG